MHKHQSNTGDEKNAKPLFKTAVVTPEHLYEMVYDPVNRQSSFVKASPDGTIEEAVHEIRVGEQTYFPLPSTYSLLEKGVIRLPSQADDYGSEEELLQDIRSFIHKYLDISEIFEQIATYYVLFTWLYEKFNELPYLRALGDFGSGKSRFLQTIGILCYKPVFTSGAATASPIFRIIDEVRGTLILDEADFKHSDMTSDVIKILNTGYQKGTSILRTEGKGVFELKAFDVFCPKIVATRETFSDKALESRFLIEEMGAEKLRANIPRTLGEDFYREAESIRNKLLMWRLKKYFQPIVPKEDIIKGIHPRLNQIIIPLLSIIENPQTQDRLKDFIVKYNAELTEERGTSVESEIVFAILKIEREGKDEIMVMNVTQLVNIGAGHGEVKLTPRKIGWYLKKKLQLKTYRTRTGFALSLKENQRKLNFWKERFGITDSDIKGESVNDVKVVTNI